MMEVTVIIPNYNGIAFIETCLNALRKQTIKDFFTIVVDNGSTDHSLQVIEEKYTEVELICFDENYGFCAAVNAGIKKARTPYVLLLNNDTRVTESFVEEMLKAIKRYKNLFSCQAKMVQYYLPSQIDDAGNFYCALGWAFARGKGKPIEQFSYGSKIFASCAGAAIYKKQVFEEIGYFDERHFAYLEDVDICYRAQIYGYGNRFVPTAQVYHVGSGTSGSQYNAFKVKLSARNNIYLIYKNMPLIQILLNLPFLIVGILMKQLFFIKKRMGRFYFLGTVSGIFMKKRDGKVKFKGKHMWNYCKIQVELWKNIGKRFL